MPLTTTKFLESLVLSKPSFPSPSFLLMFYSAEMQVKTHFKISHQEQLSPQLSLLPILQPSAPWRFQLRCGVIIISDRKLILFSGTHQGSFLFCGKAQNDIQTIPLPCLRWLVQEKGDVFLLLTFLPIEVTASRCADQENARLEMPALQTLQEESSAEGRDASDWSEHPTLTCVSSGGHHA